MTHVPPHDRNAHERESARLFAEFVSRSQAGEALDFDAFCLLHPDREAALRELDRHWRALAEVVARLSGQRSDVPANEAGARADDTRDFLGEALGRLSKRRGSFARYRVDGEFARGGMGAILRIHDQDLGRDLAMKVIAGAGESTSPSEADPRLLGRFLEEAQVTGQLDHPGIVPVHELGLDPEGRVYFTMRLVVGRDLEKIFELVRDGAEGWTLPRAVGAILKVCEATAYAHSKGVIHRDLKPANVMVGRFGEVYVMDWGLARVLGKADTKDVRLRQPIDPPSASVHTSRVAARTLESSSPLVTMDGDVVGTPAYMSPEQAGGALASIGSATDVYAVGAILYHLLAGHAPFVPPGREPDAIAIWRSVRQGPPEDLRKRAPLAPIELVAICDKAMARDAKDRYGSMVDLAEDLRAWLEGRVVHAYEAGWLAEVRKWILRNKPLAATIAIATILGLIGSATAALVLARKNEDLVAANDKSRASELKASENEQLARKSAVEAERNAAIAQERAAKILRLSDIKRLQELERRAESLWPADPTNLERYVAWLDEARGLSARLWDHEHALAEIRTRASPAGDDTPGAGATTWNFAGAEDRWQHDNQAELVQGLKAFGGERGRIADVETRLAFARTVEEITVSGSDARDRWARATASIANRDESPQYAGLHVEPQLGLVPIGKDPISGLWEFAHLQTGDVPGRDESGRLAMTEASGLVFVLLPGASSVIGAQSGDADAANYDPTAVDNEAPPHEASVDAFFLSKFEMTQGQWMRFTGANPSIYETSRVFDGKQINLMHPVEQVSWQDCADALAKLGLILPTEVQWEHAARAGTSTPWSTGEQRATLEGAANLADQAAARAGATWPGVRDWPELDDHYSVHAPIGSYRPNAFGLHDMHGNVWEWCRDWFARYDAPIAEGDGERTSSDPRFRVNRGGSFYHDAQHARSAFRNNSAPDTRTNHLGLRPARQLTR